MKLVFLILVIRIIESRKVRLIPDDELLPYALDKSVPPIQKYFSLDNFVFEQIEDDTVKVGGYFLSINSMDPTLPIKFSLRSQFFDRAKWIEAPLRFSALDNCAESVNPTRWWYNITKLWTDCPPQAGDKWLIETQILNIQTVLPPSMSLGKWRFYAMYTQGFFNNEVTKVGFMGQVEFIDVN